MSSETEILNEGRVELEVRRKDGGTEKVTVKKVAYRDMPKLAMGQVNPDVAALLYIEEKKDEKWLESLDPLSVADIIDRGDELNLPLLRRYFVRSERINSLVSENAQEKNSDAASRVLSGMVSPPSGS